MSLRLAAAIGLLLLTANAGCMFLPEVRHKPVVRNPFPQLSRVAVAPFFNQSGDPTVDGEKFADAYYTELQATPGFEVVPVGVVLQVIQQQQIDLARPEERRRLANQLGVDAIVLGSVTDYTPYYPPRLGLTVRWYAANPCFHPIPAGYGLPWGGPEEEFIPDDLAYEAELALAKAQMATQTPVAPIEEFSPLRPVPGPYDPLGVGEAVGGEQLASHEETTVASGATDTIVATEKIVAAGTIDPSLPPDWPDPHGFAPDGPQPVRPECRASDEPVLSHTQLYVGNDSEFTAALASYHDFRDDARFGGWQSYLQRSEDFIGFCCHMHIAEMLTARGGAAESKVVYRWSPDR